MRLRLGAVLVCGLLGRLLALSLVPVLRSAGATLRLALGSSARLAAPRASGVRVVSSSLRALAVVSVSATAQATPPLSIGPEFTIATDLARANSDTKRPGRPGIGFDGTNYLVVSCRDLEEPGMMFGVLVSPQAEVLNTFDIGPAPCGNMNHADVAFDGTNYLVVFLRKQEVIGTRVAPSGLVLDPPLGFIVAPTSSAPRIAFDGENFLVVMHRFIGGRQHEIFGARVSPDGQVLDQEPITIFEGPGEQVFPTVAFDGSNYLVAWRDTPFGSGPSEFTDVSGARVTPPRGGARPGWNLNLNSIRDTGLRGSWVRSRPVSGGLVGRLRLPLSEGDHRHQGERKWCCTGRSSS